LSLGIAILAACDRHSLGFVTSARDVPLSDLPTAEKAERASSFGDVATEYNVFRPGPPEAAIDWVLGGKHVGTAIDLGAGTGACTKLLLGHADAVIAVEPDERMREVLAAELIEATVLDGKGEAIPAADASADGVFASSSWHWMEPAATLAEVARVLRPAGTLGVIWSGPDVDSPFIVQARALLSQREQADSGRGYDDMAALVMGDADRPSSILVIPDDGSVPLSQPVKSEFRWDLPLTADDLIGLMGTLSWFILMPGETRTRVFAEARRLLKDFLGVEGDVTVDITFKAEAWRSSRE
jgi:SAM-dependent methyltransferase